MKSTPSPPTDAIRPLEAFRLLQTASGTLLAHGGLHVQLVQIELAQAGHRLLKRAMVLLIGFAGLISSLLLIGGLAIMVSWETPYRPWVAGAVVMSDVVLTAWAGWRLRRMLAEDPLSFTASFEELAADWDVLRAAS